MGELPTTTAATFCATVVDEWVRCGVTDAVICPGSRSTPMALALAGDGRVRVHIHHDERSAGFLALGLAAATGRPAPVLVTSGTAAVELHPAVVEAHHSRIPLICCTADRPPELLGVGAPQTIDQTELYGDAVRWFVDLGVPDDAAARAWRSVAARTVAVATGAPPGPVQWNLPFRDPLAGQPAELPAGRDQERPWHRTTRGVGTGGFETSSPPSGAPTNLGEAHGLIAPATFPKPNADRSLAEVARIVAGARGVIVAGGTGSGRGVDPEAVHALARTLGWPVLADPRSGCRTPEGTTVSHADLLLRHPRFAATHRPEVVIQLGEPPASKVQAQWLAQSGATAVVVDSDGAWLDPDRVASLVVSADPTGWCETLLGLLRTEPEAEIDETWIESWAAADAAASTAVAAALVHHPEITEPAVARDLVAAMPAGSRLVVSSSMPIRDIEWYSEARSGLTVISNRGANGIDGVVSTAVGVALAGHPTALLIGDVAFLHDTNGLVGLARRDVDLVIVVIDNDGGGIFSFLPQAELVDPDRFEQLFGTPHGVDLAMLAGAHGLALTTISHQHELIPAIEKANATGGASVIRVVTERRANVAVHDELVAAVVAALG